MASLRLLAVAVSSRRVGYVFLTGNRLMVWKMAVKPIQSSMDAAGWLQQLINKLRPDVVVTEKLDETTRKGDRSRTINSTFQRIAAENYVLDVSIKRLREFANKYEEAASLADLYPNIRPWLPKKRQFHEVEPRRMVMFDALAIAHAVIQRPSTTLASAMT